MATIYKTKPSIREKDTIYITYIRSNLTYNYALMLSASMNNMRSDSHILNNVCYSVLHADMTRHEFYRFIDSNLINN